MIDKYSRSNQFNFSQRLVEDEKEIVTNVTALKLILTRSSQAISTLPSGVCCNKAIIVDLTKVSHDWQDDHTWKKTSASKKKTYVVLTNSDGEVTDIQFSSCGDTYSVERHRYTHANSPDSSPCGHSSRT